MEEFRKIKSLNGLYEINADGTIFRNTKTKRPSKITLDYHHSGAGYFFTFVKIDGKTKHVSIAGIVAECWIGSRPTGYEVDHQDRNTHNNHYSNLRYITKSENLNNRSYNHSIAKPVKLTGRKFTIYFPSIAECSRYIAEKYNKAIKEVQRMIKHCLPIGEFKVSFPEWSD